MFRLPKCSAEKWGWIFKRIGHGSRIVLRKTHTRVTLAVVDACSDAVLWKREPSSRPKLLLNSGKVDVVDAEGENIRSIRGISTLNGNLNGVASR